MRDIRVALWGFGAMGSGIAKMIASKEGIIISGVCVRRDHLVGQEVYSYLGIDRGDRDPVVITNKIEDIVRRDLCDIVVLATDSFVEAQFDKIMFCLDRGVNVITMAEEMAWPWAQNEELADKIDALAKMRGVTVLGTGINPGFVLDYLILALSGTCEHVESIEAARVNDLAPFGKSVMVEQGVGISVERIRQAHGGRQSCRTCRIPQSMSMIAEGMGVELVEIEESATRSSRMSTENLLTGRQRKVISPAFASRVTVASPTAKYLFISIIPNRSVLKMRASIRATM